MSPMTMAAAYATVAARGIACKPIAISSITTSKGKPLPVESAGCHRVLSAAVADAATHILEGVLTSGTAASPYPRSIGRPAAAKTGTGNDGDYAAFGGYTPTLAGYVSVFNPDSPFGTGRMLGAHSYFRNVDGSLAGGTQMFGDYAPGAAWQMTFMHAALGPVRDFVPVPLTSPFYSLGSGVNSPKPPKKHHNGGGPQPGPGPGPGGGGGGGGGGGNGGGGGKP
jgi:membrane peptidoglycan carboxypeptidase